MLIRGFNLFSFLVIHLGCLPLNCLGCVQSSVGLVLKSCSESQGVSSNAKSLLTVCMMRLQVNSAAMNRSFLQFSKCCLSIAGTTHSLSVSKQKPLHSNPLNHLERKENTRFEKCRLHTKVFLDLSYHKWFLPSGVFQNLQAWDEMVASDSLLACGGNNDLPGGDSEKHHWAGQAYMAGICVLWFLSILVCLDHHARHWQHGITPLTLGSSLSSQCVMPCCQVITLQKYSKNSKKSTRKDSTIDYIVVSRAINTSHKQ